MPSNTNICVQKTTVERVIGNRVIKIDIGILLPEATNARHQPQTGKTGAGVHIQGVLHAVAQVFGGGIDGAQSAGHALQVLLPVGRQFHPSGGSLEQALAAHLHSRKDAVTEEERERLITLIEQAKKEGR